MTSRARWEGVVAAPLSTLRTAGFTSISESAVVVWRSPSEISPDSVLTAPSSDASCAFWRARTSSFVEETAIAPSTSETTSPTSASDFMRLLSSRRPQA